MSRFGDSHGFVAQKYRGYRQNGSWQKALASPDSSVLKLTTTAGILLAVVFLSKNAIGFVVTFGFVRNYFSNRRCGSRL